jgi:predicted DNA-binding transcriptional regulator YafY
MKRGSLRRIYELDRMIRLGKLESAQQAAQKFEVSARTIERDLEQLRYDLGADLNYNKEKGCYEYAGKPFVLPAQWLTEREIAILLIA